VYRIFQYKTRYKIIYFIRIDELFAEKKPRTFLTQAAGTPALHAPGIRVHDE